MGTDSTADLVHVHDYGAAQIPCSQNHGASPEAGETLVQPLDVALLARALGVVAIEDRDRVIAGDYAADTYEVHAERIARAYAARLAGADRE